VFDPFGDFATEGYLRNYDKEKNLDIVKIAEHELFRAQLPAALAFLATRKQIEYADFLEVHRILFEGLYPWAGKDRAEILPIQRVKPRSSGRGCKRGRSLYVSFLVFMSSWSIVSSVSLIQSLSIWKLTAKPSDPIPPQSEDLNVLNAVIRKTPTRLAL